MCRARTSETRCQAQGRWRRIPCGPCGRTTRLRSSTGVGRRLAELNRSGTGLGYVVSATETCNSGGHTHLPVPNQTSQEGLVYGVVSCTRRRHFTLVVHGDPAQALLGAAFHQQAWSRGRSRGFARVRLGECTSRWRRLHALFVAGRPAAAAAAQLLVQRRGEQLVLGYGRESRFWHSLW